MQDVHLLIENLKNGNFNNFVGNPNLDLSVEHKQPYEPETDRMATEARRGSDTFAVTEVPEETHENQSMNNQSVMSKNTTSIKAKRLLQIRKMEKELQRINRRYEQVTDPLYISEVKNKLKQMENDTV